MTEKNQETQSSGEQESFSSDEFTVKQEEKYRRPHMKRIDWSKVEALASLNLSMQVVVDYLNLAANSPEEKITTTTLNNRIKERYGVTWSEYQNARLTNIRAQLVKKAITMALSGDRTMLIFTLKNMVGWSDKVEETHRLDNSRPEVKLSYSTTKDELDELQRKAIETQASVVQEFIESRPVAEEACSKE